MIWMHINFTKKGRKRVKRKMSYQYNEFTEAIEDMADDRDMPISKMKELTIKIQEAVFDGMDFKGYKEYEINGLGISDDEKEIEITINKET